MNENLCSFRKAYIYIRDTTHIFISAQRYTTHIHIIHFHTFGKKNIQNFYWVHLCRRQRSDKIATTKTLEYNIIQPEEIRGFFLINSFFIWYGISFKKKKSCSMHNATCIYHQMSTTLSFCSMYPIHKTIFSKIFSTFNVGIWSRISFLYALYVREAL